MAERDGLLKRLGQGFDRYIGGLLGEDLSKMTPEERALARRQAIGAIGQGMINPANAQPAMANVIQARALQREREQMRSRAMAAEQEMPRITGRLFGTSGGMIEGLQEGEAPTPLTARYRVNPQEALARMYGTQAGRDVASVSPELLQLAQEGVTGRTVGGAVYNPLTGEFSRPQEPQTKDLTPEEAKTLFSQGYVVQRKPSGEIDVISRPSPSGAGNMTLRQVRLPGGKVQDQWIAPGQSQGIPVGPAYAPGGGKPISGEFSSKVVLAQGLRDAETRIAKLNPEAVTGLGAALSPERMRSSDYKKYTQAAREWAANLLYFKSGAAATPGEIESTWYQYFPVAGDGPEEIAQKNIARNQQMASVESALKMAGVELDLSTPYPTVSGNDDPAYKALKSGDIYVAPDGSYKRKK